MRLRNIHDSFTLIEVVIVIVILGILVITSFPNISVFNSIKFSSAGKKVLSELRYAQSIAMSRNCYVAAQFIPSANRYSFYYCNAVDPVDCFPVSALNWPFLSDPLSGGNMTTEYSSGDYRGINLAVSNFASTDMLIFASNGTPLDGTGTALVSNGVVRLEYDQGSIVFNVVPKTGKVYADEAF